MSRMVSWFSGGVSSAIATKIAIDEYGCEDVFYQVIDDEHPDTERFIAECQDWFGVEVQRMQSPFRSVDEIHRTQRYINSPGGAPCTKLLKRRVREMWEREQGCTFDYVWGLDSTEFTRTENILEWIPDHDHTFPLIEKGIDKKAAHCLMEQTGIKRPAMYELGFPNNNCIGCVKGKKGYWNLIRIHFPEVFKLRAERERDIGASCMNGLFLDELKPGEGRDNPVVPECGFFCDIDFS